MQIQQLKGRLLLVLIIIGSYVFIIAGLLIPERIQHAADGLTGKKNVNTTPSAAPDFKALVARHIILPEGNPTIIPIDNADELRAKQQMFAKALKGDMLLVFPSRVIMYRPSIDRVVEIAVIK